MLGGTKIFMRESEQTKLEYRLHQQIMASIITIQRWFRAVLERRRFLALRRASLLIQGFCRYNNNNRLQIQIQPNQTLDKLYPRSTFFFNKIEQYRKRDTFPNSFRAVLLCIFDTQGFDLAMGPN